MEQFVSEAVKQGAGGNGEAAYCLVRLRALKYASIANRTMSHSEELAAIAPEIGRSAHELSMTDTVQDVHTTKQSWTDWCTRHMRLCMCAIVIFGFLLRFIHWLQRPYILKDEIFYVETARMIAEDGPGTWSRYHFPPLLPFVLSCGERIGISAEATGGIFAMTTGTLLILVMAAIAWQIFQRRGPALLAALFTAILPYAVDLSTVALRDMPYVFFAAIAVLGLLLTARKRYLLGTGAVVLGASLGILTRFEGIELFVFPVLWFPAALVLHRGERWAVAWKGLLQIAVLATAILTVIWPIQRKLESHGCTWTFWAKGKLDVAAQHIEDSTLDDTSEDRAESHWGD